MGKIAFLFAGQGAQYTGMGKELYESSAAAKTVFDLADSIRPHTSAQCFTADKEELSQTINTQPCLYCVDLAAAKALREQGIHPDAVAGFSLGEIAALTFSQVLTQRQGFELVCERAKFMSHATEKTGGGMAAVLKLAPEKVDQLSEPYEKVFPVNYNCPGQVAVAGEKDQLAEFCKAVAEQGGKAVPLAVSGAFHSPFMDEAAHDMEQYLETLVVSEPCVTLYSNYTAEPYIDEAAAIKENIAKQVNHPVRWQTILEKMAAEGIDIFVEVGAGKTLSGLVKKTVPGARIFNVENADSLKKVIATLKEELGC